MWYRLTTGISHLTIPVVKGPCARDPLLHTFDIGVFDCGKYNFVCNESAEVIGSYVVNFNINRQLDPNESNWHAGYGVMRSPSLHTRLLNSMINQRCFSVHKSDTSQITIDS